MSPVALLPFASTLAALAATPGPGVTNVVVHALTRGFRNAVSFIFGILIGDVFYLVLSIVLAPTLSHAPHAWGANLKYLAAAYLIYLGVKAWRTAPTTPGSMPDTSGDLRAAGSGLLLTLSNPKVMVVYLGILPATIDMSRLDPGDAIFLVLLMTLVVGSVLMTYAAFANSFRGWIADGGHLQLVSRISGLALLGVAVLVALR